MAKVLRQIVLGGVLLFGVCFTAGELNAIEIVWETSAGQAQQFAALTGRPMLVYVGADFCGYCRKLEKTTWADDAVAARVSAGFVPLRVDAQRSPQLARQLGVQAFPATIVLAPNGTVLGRQNGYVDARAMLNFLQPSTPRADQQATVGR
jgi:uncharacterized protein YyaL (SSP411 family)